MKGSACGHIGKKEINLNDLGAIWGPIVLFNALVTSRSQFDRLERRGGSQWLPCDVPPKSWGKTSPRVESWPSHLVIKTSLHQTRSSIDEDKELTPRAVLKYETATSSNNPQQNNKSPKFLDAKKNHLMGKKQPWSFAPTTEKSNVYLIFPEFCLIQSPLAFDFGFLWFLKSTPSVRRWIDTKWRRPKKSKYCETWQSSKGNVGYPWEGTLAVVPQALYNHYYHPQLGGIWYVGI